MTRENYPKSPVNVDLIGLKECFHPVEKEYDRGEIITISSPEDDTIGIIKSGTAYVVTVNSDDQRRIIDYCRKGDCFGGHFMMNRENRLYYVTAKTKCTAAIISYKKLITCCDNNCPKHVELINDIFTRSMRRANSHIDILSQRTLRARLTEYFEYLRIENGGNEFTLPLPLIDLADYIAADRSAMMREIKKMNEEKIIKSERRKVTLF